MEFSLWILNLIVVLMMIVSIIAAVISNTPIAFIDTTIPTNFK